MSVRLSILIPAYGYVEGVKRILTALCAEPSNGIEIIISDDSCDDQVGRLVTDFSNHYRGKLHYRRNHPGLGAVANWNSLLEQASGEFVILLHHDEYPLGEGFVRHTLELLSANPDVDVFVMECILMSSTGKKARPHLPRILRNLVLQYFPVYLFKRNVVGPASCLFVRRALYPRFDVCLRWLVDVDVYFRLRNATARWLVCKDLKIGSTLGRKDSITASIKDELKELDSRERGYLSQKHPLARVWLTPKQHWIANGLEGFAWAGMRGVTGLYFRFLNFRRSESTSLFSFLPTSKSDHS